MPHIGCHLSFTKGFLHMGQEALSIAADTFQFFLRSPRGGQARPMNVPDAQALTEFLTAHRFGTVLAHAPYVLNGCASDAGLLEFARNTMADDLSRLAHVPSACYNFHPGGHGGKGADWGISVIAETLNQVLLPEQMTTVLLETMSGQGSEVGATFEELHAIINRVERKDRLGVCLDLCHVYGAGYDIVNDLGGVLNHFDDVIGLHRLRAIHLNDSKHPIGSHKDRHACMGEGTIGLAATMRILTHPKLRHLPFVLETPNELPGHQAEISSLRTLIQQAGQ